MRVQLTLLNGEKIDVHVPRETITIGRSNKCDLVIPQESISRQHCKVEIKGEEFFITDLGSINGVYIEGNKILPNEATPFQTYLNISFGCVTNSQFTADETRVGIQFQSNLGTSKLSNQSGNTVTIATNKQVSKQVSKQQGSSNTAPSKIETNKSAKNSNALAKNALFFFAIMAALYYFLYADKQAQSPVLNSPSAPQAGPNKNESNDHF